MIRRAGIPVLGINLEHTITAAALPRPDRDPWDHLRMAPSSIERLTLVGFDPVFTDYAAATLW